MSGCNDQQRHEWRELLKQEYEKQFEFIDPTGENWDAEATPYEAAQADLNDIESADGFLVNMWRESIGAAIGMVQASRAGRPVVVANPNWLSSQILAFYADAMTNDPRKAARVLLNILQAESRWTVLKSGERPDEPFDREKLVTAIQSACQAVKGSEIVISRSLIPDVIERLQSRGSDRKLKDSIPSSLIDEQVRGTLSEAAETNVAIAKVLKSWEGFTNGKTSGARLASHAMKLRDQPSGYATTGVSVSCSKAHTSIWGVSIRSIEDIPSEEAREVVNVIAETPGIVRIMMGPFNSRSKRARVSAFASHSKTPFVLEGGIYDQALKGTFQKMHIWVQKEQDKGRVLENITKALKQHGRWAKGR